MIRGLAVLLAWIGGAVAQGAPWTHVGTVTEVVGDRTWAVHTLARDKTRAKLWVYTPSKLSRGGVVLGLPGWKFQARSWEDEARVSDHAEALGVRVALAEMHTTIYESALYPESRADRKWCGSDCTTPGSAWVGEVVVPYLRTEHGPVHGVFGLSTGGRGAVLVPQHHPALGLRRACAMSGTFDLFSLPPDTGEYRIHANVYGDRIAHASRWRADDSLALIEKLDTLDVLLIHGSVDRDVPVSQSRALAQAMSERGGTVRLVEVPGGGHSWAMWSGELLSCLNHLVRAEE